MILINNFAFGQSRSFQLSLTGGSPSLDYYLFVQQSGKKQKITFQLTDGNNQQVISSKITRKDCNKLWAILDNYQFIHQFEKQGKLFDSIPCKAIELPDSLRIVINGDTIRKELLSWYGFYYDTNSKTCYKLKLLLLGMIDDSKKVRIIYRKDSIVKELWLQDAMITTDSDINLVSCMSYLINKYGQQSVDLESMKITLKQELKLNE